MSVPPPPPPGPPPSFGGGSSSGDGRGLLLQSIRQGTTLKRTVTNDRSAPQVVDGTSSPKNNNNSSDVARNGLGGLFAGGMPKLKPTGRGFSGGNTQPTSCSSTPEHHRQQNHDGASPRSLAGDTKYRGPPPQPPPSHQKPSMPTSASDSILTGRSSRTLMAGGGPPSLPSKPPVGGYGKPNLAPKPPGIAHNPSKPSPPPKKLVVNGSRTPVTRAQSMRVPRSPPVAPQQTPPFPPLANYRSNNTGLPLFHQSQDSLHQYRSNPPPPPRTATLPSNLNQHGLKAAAPLPPPNTPPPPTPGYRPVVRPPPPPTRPPPPPTAAPPPPPHRTSPAPRLTPTVPYTAPPAPPVRNTSIRSAPSTELEMRFADLFHLVHEFPTPQPFQRITKVYNSRNVKQQMPYAAKQQAPQPPMHIQLSGKMYSSDTSTC